MLSCPLDSIAVSLHCWNKGIAYMKWMFIQFYGMGFTPMIGVNASWYSGIWSLSAYHWGVMLGRFDSLMSFDVRLFYVRWVEMCRNNRFYMPMFRLFRADERLLSCRRFTSFVLMKQSFRADVSILCWGKAILCWYSSNKLLSKCAIFRLGVNILRRNMQNVYIYK